MKYRRKFLNARTPQIAAPSRIAYCLQPWTPTRWCNCNYRSLSTGVSTEGVKPLQDAALLSGAVFGPQMRSCHAFQLSSLTAYSRTSPSVKPFALLPHIMDTSIHLTAIACLAEQHTTKQSVCGCVQACSSHYATLLLCLFQMLDP